MLFESVSDLMTKGGYTLILLVACSVISVKVIIEKAVAMKALSEKKIDEFKIKIISAIESRQLQEGLMICRESDMRIGFFTVKMPLAGACRHIIENIKLQKEEMLESSYRKLDRDIIKLEKGLGILSTLGSVSPFIGLFGTVIGIIRSFQALSVEQNGSYLSVMDGIAEALVSTAAGLVVAVPAVVFFNYFSKKIKQNTPLLEEAVEEIVRKVESIKREAKYAKAQNG